ncbi:bifunctional adenosylcobinamide kinase/adenosylcobinamide-phosphate guanylyltransferase [Aquabacter spiritensis]|uniref:Bifunctional adenosylcobalamin biosynthesis protein n=1 Tax=Aquabacter spiritensis TaxID=933073 RepID=A0A4R3LPE9_9HYPH|nr:bifunctional adenosylcobinamide kinase/adenosylcobinamide-phosphate guanylyltransferase [Aquabacter spiritensis]TCT01576.1 adenosylcobinamide kinase /adenosylcobinamide-phosphate guanylyltransferase [Aquabacter spiritensis]
MTGRIILILGGARSGKSRHAEALVEQSPGPLAYVATAQAFDAEMTTRIDIHRARRDVRWQTHDCPFDVAALLADLPSAQPVLVDCLTLWLTNHMLADHDLAREEAALLAALRPRAADLVLVANEVGFGIVPDNALARRFRDCAGRLNQAVAARADRVILVVAGLPLTVKDVA